MKNAKTIFVCGKTSDQFSASLRDENGREIAEYNGYVPNFFPGEHFGDYIELNIDLETGQILNWKKPTQKQLRETFVDGN